MSSAKRRRVCAGSQTATTESAPPSIPTDLLLDILARTDVATVVRCAATAKSVRRAIVGPGFRGAIVAVRATDSAAAGFDPDLLLGFTYALREGYDAPFRVAQAPMKNLRFDASLLETFDPVAVRGGLVVLRRRSPVRGQSGASELRVCNSLTGDMVHLPPAAVVWDEYPPALLTVGDAGRSFELLVAGGRLQAQTFSSKDGRWAAAVDIRVSPRHCHDVPRDGSHPVVLGGTVVHWLCRGHRAIKVLDIGKKQATHIELPPDYLGRVRYTQSLDSGLLLASSGDGRLGLLVSETFEISMWTLEEGPSSSLAAARWTRQVVVRRQAICREAGADSSYYSVHFMGFGERSGAVILQIRGVGLVRLDLGAKEAVVLHREFKLGSPYLFRLCLHETDLSSLLQAMKPF